jgi:hypothetical protein
MIVGYALSSTARADEPTTSSLANAGLFASWKPSDRTSIPTKPRSPVAFYPALRNVVESRFTARMPTFHEILAERVSEWRKAAFPSPNFPAIAEIFEFATLEDGSPRFLRWPQIRALETYWYLRLVEKTPQIFDLYKGYYQTPTELLGSLGLYSKEVQDYVIDHGINALWDRIRTDDAFSKANIKFPVRHSSTYRSRRRSSTTCEGSNGR